MVNSLRFRNFAIFLVLLCAVFCANFLHSSTQKNPTKHEGVAALKLAKVKYERLGNWKAEFSQEVVSVGLGKTGRFSMGEFAFVAPNKFKFLIHSPDKSEFITDGVEGWFIQYNRIASKHGTLVKHFKKVSEIELSKYLVFLNGQVETLKDFQILGKVQDEEIELSLIPNAQSEISSIHLFFNQASNAPSKIVIEDSIQTRTVLKLNKFQKLSAEEIQKMEFKPVIPKNAKIEEL